MTINSASWHKFTYKVADAVRSYCNIFVSIMNANNLHLKKSLSCSGRKVNSEAGRGKVEKESDNCKTKMNFRIFKRAAMKYEQTLKNED